jgi:branched-chain amino acid transport system ATP-binding protein
VLECDVGLGRETGLRREHECELVPDVIGESFQTLRIEPTDVLVERVHENPEGQVALELGGGAAQNEGAALVGAHAELGQQAGLADSRLAHELHGRRTPALEIREKAVERAELFGSADEMLGNGQRASTIDNRAGLFVAEGAVGCLMRPCEAGHVGAAGTLEARDVRVHIRGVKAVDGVDLSMREGEILGVIGPNGAGKTTLVAVLAGFQRATTGVVRLNGVDITAWSPSEIARAGLVRTFQDARLFPGLTSFENVEAAALSSGASRRPARSLARDLLQRLGLEHRSASLARGLPHHEERRLAIARALAARPTFVLLDEPAAGLTGAQSAELGRMLASTRDALGLGLLVIEHDMPLIMQLSERIQVLHYGKTIAMGTPAEVRNDPDVLTAYLGTGKAVDARRL